MYKDNWEYSGRYQEKNTPPDNTVQETEVTDYQIRRFLIEYPVWKKRSLTDILEAILECDEIYEVEEGSDEDGSPVYLVKHSPNGNWENEENLTELDDDIEYFESPEAAAIGLKMDFDYFFDEWAEEHDISGDQYRMIYEVAIRSNWKFFHDELLSYFSSQPQYRVSDDEDVSYNPNV